MTALGCFSFAASYKLGLILWYILALLIIIVSCHAYCKLGCDCSNVECM